MNLLDMEIIALDNEILALKQSKLKTISQVKFKETTLENIQVTAPYRRTYLITPANDVHPLLTARIKIINGTIPTIKPRAEWDMYQGQYRFSLFLDNSTSTTATFDIIFTSTSELNIVEDI